jgi:CRISPR-associated protein Cmr1
LKGINVAPGRITATFEVVTPLFLGGADPANSAELRAPSIKGMLRFWWRALAWSRHGGDMDTIRREEARLFGAAGEESSDAKRSTGQASFILRVRHIKGLKVISKGEVLRQRSHGMGYFGYGLMVAFGPNAGRLERPCLSTFQFTIELIIRRTLDLSAVNSLVDALKVMGLLGGLGSRSRRGYGSLSLVSLVGDVGAWEPPATKDGYAAEVRTVIKSDALKLAEPPYTAFSKLSWVVVVTEEGPDPLALLDRIGKQMQRYRSWGHDGRVNGEESERNFKDDHDWFKSGASRAKHPRRVVFGLPHNYDRDVGIVSENYDRRGSPLFVHIHKLENGYIGIVSILPANFLPPGEKLSIRNHRGALACRPQIEWAVLDRFIDGTKKNSRELYFPNKVKILP